MTDSQEWRTKLSELHGATTSRVDNPLEWESTQTRAQEIGKAASLVHTFGISLDEIHDAALKYAPDDVPLAAIRTGIDPEVIELYPEEALQGVSNAIKGALMELRVEQLIEGGQIEFPEGAVSFELASQGAKAVDGYFLDAQGNVVQAIQIKASASDAIIQEHLERFPEIETVLTTSEASELAIEHGIESTIDTGITNTSLEIDVGKLIDPSLTPSEVVDEIVPQIALSIAGIELGWNLFRGMERNLALEKAGKRVGRATGYSVAAWALSSATGIESTRLILILGSESIFWITARMDTELAPSIAHLENLSRIVSTLGRSY